MRKIMRKVMIFSIIIPLITTLWGPDTGKASPAPLTGLSAEAAAVIDVTSGRLLYSKEGDKRMLIASLTKVMTAIVAIEQGNLADMVLVGNNAAGKEGSSIFLTVNQKMSLLHLLYGLMLRSGNDAAIAIAEHVGGSVEGFAYLMNQKARELGMDRSQFMNPSGLDQEGHYSTANDMAILTAYALKNPVFQEIVKTKVKKVPNPDEGWDYVWANKNKMLSIYTGGDGVKTGYTKAAGRCLISSATRGGQQVAVITLNASNDWADHGRALDYSFKHYPLSIIVEKGKPIEGTDLVSPVTFSYPLSGDEIGLIHQEIVAHDTKSLSHRLGEQGQLRMMLGDQLITTLPLYDAQHSRLQSTEQPTFRFKASGKYQLTSWNAWFYYWGHTLYSLFTTKL